MTGYTFQDEFDGPAGSPPDPARWSYDLGAGGWGNHELQSYTDDPRNVFQDGRSHLVIRATRQVTAATGDDPPGIRYHSARITTRDRFAQCCGSFEARIKVASRRGLWPAFWLMGQDIGTAGWPDCGEVDVLEDFGYSTVQSSVHAPAGGDAVHTAPPGPALGLRLARVPARLVGQRHVVQPGRGSLPDRGPDSVLPPPGCTGPGHRITAACSCC